MAFFMGVYSLGIASTDHLGITMKIPDNVVVALIALSGVLISGLVSFVVSSVQSNASAANLRLEVEQRYNQKLYEKRLEAYPLLYRATSDLGKNLELADLRYKRFTKSRERIDQWDSQHAVLVSPSVIALLLELRNTLTDMALAREQDALVSSADRKLVFGAALKLEQAIRNEIGVYAVGGFHNALIQEQYPHSWKYLQGK